MDPSTAAWTRSGARSGHHYYETVVEAQVVNGQKQEVKRQVQKTRWQPAQGHRRDRYDDVARRRVEGSARADRQPSRDLRHERLVPYDPRYLAGFHAEEYAVGLEEGWQKADQRIRRDQDARCQRDIPGDTTAFPIAAPALRADLQARAAAALDRGVPLPGQDLPLPRERSDRRSAGRGADELVQGRHGDRDRGRRPLAGIVFAVRASKGG
ncbi:MAG: hypothetical protein R3B99_01675 [Polyangiales bacterium]